MSSISASGASQRECKPLSSTPKKVVPFARRTENLVFSIVPRACTRTLHHQVHMYTHLQLFRHLKNGFHIDCATLLQDSKLAKIWCKSRDTYNNEQYKIYKIVEGVSVHDVVHDVYPSFQSDDLERKDKWFIYVHVSAQLATCWPVRWRTLPVLCLMLISQKRAMLWGPSRFFYE